ncbi:porin family protein [Ferruginibacter sp. SUN106]|uniref:porin family protein n=1 Tax=Ferruginibacter sp. SUN106 TaxID=2978348 RepID=UPI003D363B6B
MKTKLLLTAAISIISFSAFSQSLKIGAKGGVTMNKITGQTFKEQFSYGYHIGGFATIGLGKKFAIQPEVLFNQINVDTSSTFSSIYKFNKLDNVQLKYLSIPILLNYNAGKLITLQLGPQFGILMNKSNTFIENGKDAFKSGDFSMLGGVQLNISHFKVYGRYAVGLNNLNDIDNKDKWKSQSVQLGVGLTL